jgi:predicted RNA-binding protein with EMAP domain
MSELDYPRSNSLNFGQGDPTPCDPVNLKLAEAVERLLETKAELQKARDNVPNYTGQWDPIDYYADAQEDYNRAVDNYAEAVRLVVAKS